MSASRQSSLTMKDETAILRAAVRLEQLAKIIDAAQLDGRLTEGDRIRHEARDLRKLCRTATS
jgi:hypothetical protein